MRPAKSAVIRFYQSPFFFLIYFIALFSVIWIHVRDYKIINSLLFRTTRYNKLYGAVLLNPGSNYNLYS